ncbi:hypothetical protein LTR15_000148 [Elasticomyces elasticus]|nr:hypothetical protein LTR15_000148 [Elasticomyces elasticus]
MGEAHAQISSDDDIEIAESLTDVHAHKTVADAKETGLTAPTYNDDSARHATTVESCPYFLRLYEALRRYTEASGLHNVEQPVPIDEVVNKLKFRERQVVQEVSNGMPDPLSCQVKKAMSSLREVSSVLAVDELAELIDAEEQPSCFQAFIRVLSTFRGSNILVVGNYADSRITDTTMDNVLVIPGPAVLQKRSISRSEHFYPALNAFCVLVTDVRRYHANNLDSFGAHESIWSTSLASGLEGAPRYPLADWHTFTSTNPLINDVIVLPGNHNGRISSGWRGSPHGPPVPAELPPTFTKFFGNQGDKNSTVSTPTVRGYVDVDYQCRFGRVLWAGIAHAEGHKVISFARQKLFNAATTADILSKSEKVEQEAVALLSTLINLEPGSETSAGHNFAQKQVDQHMRVALKVVPEMWILDTTRWPEPILAQAAIEVAKQKVKLHPDGDTAYNVALGKVESLFRRNVIEQRDIAGRFGRATLMAAQLCLDEWFTLTDLFECLLGKQSPLWVKRLPQELQRAQFNWNHFTSVPTEYVHHATDDQKWQYLFRNRQAIQGWKGMSKFDCYLLGYLGDIEKDFEFKKLCIVAVSFKHTNGSFGPAKSLDAKQRHFTWTRCSEQSDALRRYSLETTKIQSKEARPGVKRKVARDSYRDRFTFIGRAFGDNPMLCVSMDLGREPGEDGSVQFGYHPNDTDRCGFEGDMYCVDLYGLDKGLYPCVGNSVEALSGLMQHFEDLDRVEHEIMYSQFKWRNGTEEEDSGSE